jgi:OOP family OmpA-OmpF porin
MWGGLPVEGKGQDGTNLVWNGSFEERTWCPAQYNSSELRTLKHWAQPGAATPDHFDACGSDAGVPRNTFGSQAALSGQAYAGVVVHSESKREYREYLQAPLSRPLRKGEWVCVSWWVSVAEEGRLVCDGMGAYLSDKPVKQKGEQRIEVMPQIDNPRLHMLSDVHSWIKLSDVVQASGGEAWITLGNFRPPTSLVILERGKTSATASNWAYLYVDDVVVEPVSQPADCSCLNDKYQAEVTDPPWEVFLVDRWDPEAVLFAFDRADLDSVAQQQLQDLARTLRQNPFLSIEVNGHTDIVGPDGYNLELSERRARAVMAYLVDQGVAPQRMELAYHGSRLPTADNETPDGRRQNRRVEFEVLEHAFLPRTP